ncbi:MAG: transposase [Nitrospira sp.]|nr:transposase [Nitrospira sp.]
MERVPRQKYTKEFREQAVQLVQDQVLTIPEAARRLAMSDKTLANWVFQARRGQLATLGETRRPVTELEAEVSRLKGELAEARMERNILKKAPAYFAKAQLCKAIGPTYAPWVRLAILTGMQKSEQFRLRWTDVDMEHGFLTLGETKSGTVQYVPLTEESIAILRNLDS